MFKKSSKLNTIQRKYCSCLVKVRSKKTNPRMEYAQNQYIVQEN